MQIEPSGTTTFLQTVKIIRMCWSDTKRTVQNIFLQTIKIIWMSHPSANKTIRNNNFFANSQDHPDVPIWYKTNRPKQFFANNQDHMDGPSCCKRNCSVIHLFATLAQSALSRLILVSFSRFLGYSTPLLRAGWPGLVSALNLAPIKRTPPSASFVGSHFHCEG